DRWSVRRNQGAAGWLLSGGGTRSQRSHQCGGAHSSRAGRQCGSAAGAGAGARMIQLPEEGVTMELNPYLMFNGNCEEAFLFYQQLLGGDLERVRFRDLPGAAPTEPGWDGKLAHAALKVAGRTLMASDAPPPYQQ